MRSVDSARLIALQAREQPGVPLVCIPGAGASVTTFFELAMQLGTRWPVYGLQSRAARLSEAPRLTVETVAAENLELLEPLTSEGPIDLLGHSYGGLVAFEMALRLNARENRVASLTLIDSVPTAFTSRTIDGRTERVFRGFVEALENMYSIRLMVSDEDYAADLTAFVAAVQAALVNASCSPRGTGSLTAALASYAVAQRSTYAPATIFRGRLNLALVREPCLNERGQMLRRDDFVDIWRYHARALNVWYGPGNHFSILNPPHIREVARWWLRARQPDTNGRDNST